MFSFLVSVLGLFAYQKSFLSRTCSSKRTACLISTTPSVLIEEQNQQTCCTNSNFFANESSTAKRGDNKQGINLLDFFGFTSSVCLGINQVSDYIASLSEFACRDQLNVAFFIASVVAAFVTKGTGQT